ncbi:MAG: hypothetical protein ACE5JF_04685 [Anaerolineales bacterium]
MSKQRGSSIAASAQDIGGADDGIQRERGRASTVQMADGSRVLLSVVAVGTDSGESAERVVEQVFQAVSGSPANSLAAALRRGLEIASQGLVRRGAEVAGSAVAIRRGRLYFASVGDTVIFRVAGQESIRLTRPSSSRLGAQEAPRIQAGPEAGFALQRGDRVVAASAGFLVPSPADGKPFVDPNAISEHIKNLPAEDAAKHLVSIALGRDVGSNVTIAVLGEAKEKRTLPIAALAAAGIIGVFLVIAGALALLNSPESVTTTDFGFVVLVRGGVLADTGEGAPALVRNLDAIPAGAKLSAQTDAVLGLQSTFDESGELTRTNVYLAQGADVRLSEIDVRGEGSQSRTSRLGLDAGSVLVFRQSGTWEYQILALTEAAVMIGAGPAAMGVGTSGGSLQLDCLIGICRYEAPSGEELLLDGGKRILVGASSGIAQESTIPPDSVMQWNELCGGCMQGTP